MMIFSQEDEVEKKYKFGRTLGQGTFATVKMATSLEDNQKWAVKIIKRSALTSEDEDSLKMEIQILQLTNHPHIVSVKEVFYCKHYVYLVMDLMTGGELFDRIVTKDHYSEQEAKQALQQIVLAVKYCHEKNIVHRDLKPENILYQSPDENAPLKLADFGLATMLKPNQLMTVACGTPGYVAPEILRGQAYGKEVDMWSVGVVLYILLCGFPPFYDDNNKRLFAQIVHANYSFPDPYWTNISPSAKDLVQRLLVVDPKQRLTADQVLAHPWMFEDGSASTLDHFKPNLKSYNAKRRFRSAIRAVQITHLLKNLTKSGQKQPTSILEVIESKPEEKVNANGTVSDDDSDLDDSSITSNENANQNKSTQSSNPVKLEKIPEASEGSSRDIPPITIPPPTATGLTINTDEHINNNVHNPLKHSHHADHQVVTTAATSPSPSTVVSPKTHHGNSTARTSSASPSSAASAVTSPKHGKHQTPRSGRQSQHHHSAHATTHHKS